MPALTTSGSPTIAGSTAIIDSTGSDRVQFPASLISSTQGWFVGRVTDTAEGATSKRLMSWRPDGSNWLEVWQGSTGEGGNWRCTRQGGGTGSVTTTCPSNETGNETVIFIWTATTIDVVTSAFDLTPTAQTTIPTLSGSIDIGRFAASATAWLINPLYWCAAGTGTVSDADWDTVIAFGDTDPSWGSFPSAMAITFLWKCDDFNYQDTGDETQSFYVSRRRSVGARR